MQNRDLIIGVIGSSDCDLSIRSPDHPISPSPDLPIILSSCPALDFPPDCPLPVCSGHHTQSTTVVGTNPRRSQANETNQGSSNPLHLSFSGSGLRPPELIGTVRLFADRTNGLSSRAAQ